MGVYKDLLGTLQNTFKVGKAKFDASALTAQRTHTLPDASTTLVGIDTVQTLTNKILDGSIVPVSSLGAAGTLGRLKALNTDGFLYFDDGYSWNKWTLTPATLPVVGTWKCDIDPDTISGSDGATIATASDQSGNSNDATQSTTANKPVIKRAIVNGHDVIRFSSSGATGTQFLNLPNFLNALTQAHVFVVVKATAYPPGAIASSGLWDLTGASPDSATTHYTYTDSTIYECGLCNVRKNYTPTSSTAAWHIYSLRSKSGEWTAKLDTVQQYTTATNTYAATTTPAIGTSRGGYASDGDWARFLVNSSVLSASDEARVMAYLKARYATP